MSIDFYGKDSSGKPIMFRHDDPRSLNLCNGNAAALLGLLRLPLEQGYGEAPLPDVCRAIQAARAEFDYRVDAHTRRGVDGRGSGGCRVISPAFDEHDLADRLTRFETLVCDMTEAGAVSLYWA